MIDFRTRQEIDFNENGLRSNVINDVEEVYLEDVPYVEPDLDLVVNGVSLREFLGEEL